MDITPLVDSLRTDLAQAAEVGGIEVQAAAEKLLLALDPALRLTIMDALSQAAAEISQALPGVAIEVRLRGREPEFAVMSAPQPAAARPMAGEPQDGDDGDEVARITLRIPEALKARAETLAAGQGQSLNTWLVAAARAAASGESTERSGHSRHGRYGLSGKHIRGWAK
jgi:HicB-like protein involved in pilus formation